MQYRAYGKTGIDLSIIGLCAIVVMGVDQGIADWRVRNAFDRGVNYFDVAPTYGDAEDRLGPALVGLRDKVFLSCKTEQRDKISAAASIDQSLTKMKTDHFDLYQLHAVSSLEEAQKCLAPDGAMEAVLKAREAGKIKYIGFSAHSVEAALYLLDQFQFDSVLFPFNATMFCSAGFGPQVLEKAISKGAARMALKAMAWRPWVNGPDETIAKNTWYEPYTDREKAALALRWTLSLPITAAIPPGDPELFEFALSVAESFTPLSDDERTEIEKYASESQPLFQVGASPSMPVLP